MLLTVATNSIGLWIIAAVVFYAVVWVILTFDTIRLVRLVKARPQARPFIEGSRPLCWRLWSAAPGMVPLWQQRPEPRM